MNVLLDTHVFLWLAEDSQQLSKAARDAIWDADRIVLSVASTWEVGIKHSLKKLWISEDDLQQALQQCIDYCGVEVLPITFEHSIAAVALPLLHRDPFDRMIVAQAKAEGFALVSQDANIHRYDCNVIW